jgi:serine/threonine protein phosphatase PrpC
MTLYKYYSVSGLSNIGHRAINQDAFAIYEDPKTHSVCIIIADGLGGHPGGEIISQLLVDNLISLVPSFAHYFKQDGISATESLVQEACLTLRQTFREKYSELDAHTTLALAWIDQEKWVSCHVGDSRIYLLSDKKITWRTKDHTPVESLYLEGKISESVMYAHPMQNILLRTINTQVAPDPDITLHPQLEENQTLLACSDGFWGNLSYADISLLTNKNNKEINLEMNLQNCFNQMIKNHSNLDNQTAIILQKI